MTVEQRIANAKEELRLAELELNGDNINPTLKSIKYQIDNTYARFATARYNSDDNPNAVVVDIKDSCMGLVTDILNKYPDVHLYNIYKSLHAPPDAFASLVFSLR